MTTYLIQGVTLEAATPRDAVIQQLFAEADGPYNIWYDLDVREVHPTDPQYSRPVKHDLPHPEVVFPMWSDGNHFRPAEYLRCALPDHPEVIKRVEAERQAQAEATARRRALPEDFVRFDVKHPDAKSLERHLKLGARDGEIYLEDIQAGAVRRIIDRDQFQSLIDAVFAAQNEVWGDPKLPETKGEMWTFDKRFDTTIEDLSVGAATRGGNYYFSNLGHDGRGVVLLGWKFETAAETDAFLDTLGRMRDAAFG